LAETLLLKFSGRNSLAETLLAETLWLKLSGRKSGRNSPAKTRRNYLAETLGQKILGKNYLAGTLWQKFWQKLYANWSMESDQKLSYFVLEVFLFYLFFFFHSFFLCSFFLFASYPLISFCKLKPFLAIRLPDCTIICRSARE
jgi:hypothetical protein